jgi:hypothetical protein
MENDLMYAFAPILNASKSKDYKNRVREKHTILMNFLISNNLLKLNPLDADGFIKEDVILYANDFNDGAEKLFGKPVMKWLQYIDKGGSIDNLKILQKGLDDIRATSTK